MSPDNKLQNLLRDLNGLLSHWGRLAEHVKQPPLPRRIIQDRARELKVVIEKNA